MKRNAAIVLILFLITIGVIALAWWFTGYCTKRMKAFADEILGGIVARPGNGSGSAGRASGASGANGAGATANV